MTLSRTTVGIIVALIVVALSGLVIVQAALLTTTWQHQEQAFRSNVMSALGTVQRRLLARETMEFAISMDEYVASGDDSVSVMVTALTGQADSTGLRKIVYADRDDQPHATVEDSFLVYHVNSPQHVRLQVQNPESGERMVLVDTFRTAGDYREPIPDLFATDAVFFWDCRTDSTTKTFAFDYTDSGSAALPRLAPDGSQVFIRTLVNQLQLGDVVPIDERLNSIELDSLISASLTSAGVDLSYEFAVHTPHDDSLYFASQPNNASHLRESEFRTPLFPHDLFSQRADLLVAFPGRDVFLWRQLGSLAIPTIVLMTIIVGCFVYTIRTILAQKRFSGLLVDFINNMTHEFKTPISTVQLACDAIKRTEVTSEPTQVLRFNQMIEEEARRMKGQADKILQMAVLERGDCDLSATPVDIHHVIDKAVAVVALHVEKRNGRLSSHLNASHKVVVGDAIHLTNVVHNLLDNASKYSPTQPSVAIETIDTETGLKIVITDNGIGMSPEHQKMVFQKYFRVPSGNVHDVKGFGLGLSYVKLMVEAHGGTITLTSRLGEGTRVEVALPATKSEE